MLIFFYRDGGPSFYIQNVTDSDYDDYCCYPLDAIEGCKHFYIEPMQEYANTSREIQEYEGHTISLECQIYPVKTLTSVQWTYNNQKLEHNRNDNNLCIKNIKRDNSGIYSCSTLYRGSGRNYKIHLNVYHPPVIIGFLMNNYTYLDKDVIDVHEKDFPNSLTIRCVTIGNPEPETWFEYESEKITNTDTIRIFTNSSKYSEHYTCVSKNYLVTRKHLTISIVRDSAVI